MCTNNKGAELLYGFGQTPCFLLSITISIGQLYFAICCGEQLPCSFPPKLLSSRGQVKFQLVRCCLCALFSAPSRWLLWSFGAKACWFLCKKRTNSSKSAKKVRSNLQLNPGRGIETLDLTWLKIKIFTVNYEYKFKNSLTNFLKDRPFSFCLVISLFEACFTFCVPKRKISLSHYGSSFRFFCGPKWSLSVECSAKTQSPVSSTRCAVIMEAPAPRKLQGAPDLRRKSEEFPPPLLDIDDLKPRR